jgi:hypothetical protein
MGLFNKIKEPVLLKESSNVEAQIERFRDIEQLLIPEGQSVIRQDIKFLEHGMIGEKNIAFELKNSHMPMCILHDIYLEDGDLSAQIDYLVFTKKICFVIECKNLYGDIDISSTGDFVRTIDIGGKKKKEGIYSPITQNQRHLELMKKIRVDSKSNILTKYMVGKYFEDCYKSVVVLANPKTVLNAKYAKKEVKEKVIRADQLVKYIKDTYDKSREVAVSDENMLEWAQSYLNLHKEIEKDYTKKYEQYKVNNSITEVVSAFIPENNDIKDVAKPLDETEIFKELKAYRLRKSREENIKPYFIYNDNQLKDLISIMPRTKEELRMMAGFGETKANKYGADLLKILNNF